MTTSPAAERRERILRAAVQQRLLDPEHAVLAAFVDLDGVRASVEALHRAFPRSVAVLHTFAGPCCFAGDLVAEARPLPELAPGDLVALLDTGAYYASTPFHYNSLTDPAVHSVRSAADGSIRFGLLRAAENIGQVLARTGGRPA